jgi:hypothetical protein
VGIEGGSWCTTDDGRGDTWTFQPDPPTRLAAVEVELERDPAVKRPVDVEIDSGAKPNVVHLAETGVVDAHRAKASKVSVRFRPEDVAGGRACVRSVTLIAPGPVALEPVVGIDAATLKRMLAAIADARAGFGRGSRSALGRVVKFPLAWSEGFIAGLDRDTNDEGTDRDARALVKRLRLPWKMFRGEATPVPEDGGFTASWSEESDRGECEHNVELHFTAAGERYVVDNLSDQTTCDG